MHSGFRFLIYGSLKTKIRNDAIIKNNKIDRAYMSVWGIDFDLFPKQ